MKINKLLDFFKREEKEMILQENKGGETITEPQKKVLEYIKEFTEL